MRRISIVLLVFACLFFSKPFTPPLLATPVKNAYKAAFIREGTLWISEDRREIQLTKTSGAHDPKWSFDGRWISYGQPDGVWVYDTQERMTYQVYRQSDAHTEWAPDKNMLAILDAPVLNTVDLGQGKPKPFENVALGVGNYSWLPDGTGFLASANANLRPDGWTNPELYKINLNKQQPDLFKNAKPFFTIPQPLKMGDTEILSVHTSTFKWSRDGKWISFIVSPTASWSMDSNLLCTLSADGKEFSPIAEMLVIPRWFQWSPHRNELGFIKGGERLIAGFANKKLAVTQLPQKTETILTPTAMIELDFDWYTDDIIASSRARAGEFSNDPAKRPQPALYQVNLKQTTQKQISSPPPGLGDYQPHYLKSDRKLTWIRTSNRTVDSWLSGMYPKNSVVWLADADGKNPQPLISNVQQISWFERKP